MKPQIPSEDYELISAYLDGELNRKSEIELKSRLARDVELSAALKDIAQTRYLIRNMPDVKVPRSFILTAKMVGKTGDKPNFFPRFMLRTLQLSAALSSLLLIYFVLSDLLHFNQMGYQYPSAAPQMQAEMDIQPAQIAQPESMATQSRPGLLAENAATSMQTSIPSPTEVTLAFSAAESPKLVPSEPKRMEKNTLPSPSPVMTEITTEKSAVLTPTISSQMADESLQSRLVTEDNIIESKPEGQQNIKWQTPKIILAFIAVLTTFLALILGRLLRDRNK